MTYLATVRARFDRLHTSYDIMECGSGRPIKKRPSFKAWLNKHRDRVREGLQTQAEAATRHLNRDYRDWHRNWQPGQPIMIGSGRTADWCHITFLQYARIAELLHERLGWSGQLVRDAAHALQRGVDGGGHDWQPPIRPLPLRELLQVARLSPSAGWTTDMLCGWEEKDANTHQPPTDPNLASRTAQWRLWIDRVVGPAWGRYMLDCIVAEVKNGRKTPSLVVGEIRRLHGATDVTDMRGCSGCQYLAILAERPELHDELLAQAGAPTPVRCGTLDGIRVPFGLAAPVEFDHVLVLGLSYEIRVRSADYASLSDTNRLRMLR